MISVIICTYNRDKYIYNVLQSVAENDFPIKEYEIVLINNNCTDHTESECQRFHHNYPGITFRCFNEPKQGLSHARNLGIKEANGNVLVYVDDDALVNKEYLQTYAKFFETHPDVDAAGGPIIPQYETKEPSWMSHYTRMLLTGYKYNGDSVKEFSPNDYPGGGNAAYRTSVFEKVGLFNVELGRKGDNLAASEEKDIFDKMKALGMRIYYLPTAILYHLIPERKLTDDYFDQVSYGIGQSERFRTKRISERKYRKRLFQEAVKWVGTFALWLGFALQGEIKKGNKLVAFRRMVTKGLLSNQL